MKRGSLIAIWIAIAALWINQALSARHEYLMHQQIRDQIGVLREDVLWFCQQSTDVLRKMMNLTEILPDFECNSVVE